MNTFLYTKLNKPYPLNITKSHPENFLIEFGRHTQEPLSEDVWSWWPTTQKNIRAHWKNQALTHRAHHTRIANSCLPIIAGARRLMCVRRGVFQVCVFMCVCLRIVGGLGVASCCKVIACVCV